MLLLYIITGIYCFTMNDKEDTKAGYFFQLKDKP